MSIKNKKKHTLRYKLTQKSLNALAVIAVAIILFPIINTLHIESVKMDVKSLNGSNITVDNKQLLKLEKKYQQMLQQK